MAEEQLQHEKKAPAPPSERKLTYAAPRLTRWGSVEDLTGGGAGGLSDSGGGASSSTRSM